MASSVDQEAPSLAELKAALDDYKDDDHALDDLAWRVFRIADKVDDAVLSEDELDQVLASYGVFLNPVALRTYFEFITHGDKDLHFHQFTDEFPLFVRLVDRHSSYASLLQKIWPSTKSQLSETTSPDDNNAPADGDDPARRKLLFDTKLATSGKGNSSSDNQPLLASPRGMATLKSSMSKGSSSSPALQQLSIPSPSSPLSSPTARSMSPMGKLGSSRRMSSTGLDPLSSPSSPRSPTATATSPTGKAASRRMSTTGVDTPSSRTSPLSSPSASRSMSPITGRMGSRRMSSTVVTDLSSPSRSSPLSSPLSKSPYTMRQNPRDPNRKFHVRACKTADRELVSVEQLQSWRAVFNKIDEDGDGLIKLDDFVAHIMKRFPDFKMAPFPGDVDFACLLRKLYPGVVLTDGQCEEMVEASTIRIKPTPVKISDDMQKNVKAAFEIMDTSGDGFIKPHELVEGLVNLGMDRKGVDLVYLELFIDEENPKGVDLERYTQWYIKDFSDLDK